MRQFDENTFNQEWVDYWTTLVNIGVSECFSNDFFTINGNNLEASLKITPASITEDTGLAYPGALLSHIRLSTMIAEKMAKMISGTFTIDINSLRKVCSLMHLSKIEMFEKNEYVVYRGDVCKVIDIRFNELQKKNCVFAFTEVSDSLVNILACEYIKNTHFVSSLCFDYGFILTRRRDFFRDFCHKLLCVDMWHKI